MQLAAKVHCDGALAADLLLELEHPVEERLGRWRTPRDVDVDGHDAVAAAHDRVRVVVVAAAVRARPHGHDPARPGHLVVDLAQDGRHLVCERPGDDHDVRLAGRRAEDDAEAVLVVARHGHVHHLDGAAREAKGHWPEGAGAHVADDLVDACGHVAERGRVLRPWRWGSGGVFCAVAAGGNAGCWWDARAF